MEKCYRDIQNRGQIAGVNLLEVFVLLGVPIILFPIFTLLNLNFGFILIIEVFLYAVFRLANRVSHFEFGLLSFIYSKFIWPKKLSAYGLDESQYIKDRIKPDKRVEHVDSIINTVTAISYYDQEEVN